MHVCRTRALSISNKTKNCPQKGLQMPLHLIYIYIYNMYIYMCVCSTRTYANISFLSRIRQRIVLKRVFRHLFSFRFGSLNHLIHPYMCI